MLKHTTSFSVPLYEPVSHTHRSRSGLPFVPDAHGLQTDVPVSGAIAKLSHDWHMPAAWNTSLESVCFCCTTRTYGEYPSQIRRCQSVRVKSRISRRKLPRVDAWPAGHGMHWDWAASGCVPGGQVLHTSPSPARHPLYF